MKDITKKIVRFICDGDANCKKYVRGALENFRPKFEIAHECTCQKEVRI